MIVERVLHNCKTIVERLLNDCWRLKIDCLTIVNRL